MHLIMDEIATTTATSSVSEPVAEAVDAVGGVVNAVSPFSLGAEDFFGIVIVGVVITALIEFIKNRSNISPTAVKLLTAVACLVIAGGYVWVRSTPYFATFVAVLMTASTIWALFVNRGSVRSDY